jgi:hypothetical protein
MQPAGLRTRQLRMPARWVLWRWRVSLTTIAHDFRRLQATQLPEMLCHSSTAWPATHMSTCQAGLCWMQTVGRATGAAADTAEAVKQKAADVGSKAYDATAQVQNCTFCITQQDQIRSHLAVSAPVAGGTIATWLGSS